MKKGGMRMKFARTVCVMNVQDFVLAFHVADAEWVKGVNGMRTV